MKYEIQNILGFKNITSTNLQHCIEVFVDEGLDDMNSWTYLTDDDLTEFGFRKAHLHKWRNRYPVEISVTIRKFVCL